MRWWLPPLSANFKSSAKPRSGLRTKQNGFVLASRGVMFEALETNSGTRMRESTRQQSGTLLSKTCLF